MTRVETIRRALHEGRGAMNSLESSVGDAIYGYINDIFDPAERALTEIENCFSVLTDDELCSSPPVSGCPAVSASEGETP